MTQSSLSAAIILAVVTLSSAYAQQSDAQNTDNSDEGNTHAEHDSHAVELDNIEVEASPLGGTVLDATQPVDILTGEALDDRKQSTIGETLQAELGVQSSYFGPGAGRPIIRGLGGSRVRILENGISTLDASALSDDHAVSAEPLLIDSIEVLRGPATLLYGSAASAGAINIVDNRIPKQQQDFSGAVEVRGNTVADEFAGVVRLDGGFGAFQFHLDGFYRDTNDYDIPGFALSDALLADLPPEELAEQESGTLANSAIETVGGTFGGSIVGDWGYAGFAFKTFDTQYGIPAELEEEEEEEGEGGEEEGGVSIDLEQQRYEFNAGLFNPLPAIEQVEFKLANVNYEHQELEGDEVGTTFLIDSTETRLELKHAPIGRLNGAFGIQYSDEDLIAIGAEAFIPANNTESLGLFLVEELSLGDVKLSGGFRWQDDDISLANGLDVNGITDRSFTAISISGGAIWQFAPDWQATFNWQRSERSPTSEALFADGPHIATQTFEIGDPTLNEETSNNFDLGIHKYIGNWHLRADVFYNNIDDFIFLADTPDVEDGLPVRIWSQQDAEFYGFEAEASYLFEQTPIGDLEWRVFTDMVQAEQDNGDAIPRLSPTRIGTGLDWHYGNLRANLNYYHVFARDDVASFETTTDSYNMLTANVAYKVYVGQSEIEFFVQGVNLTDEVQRVHTSFLKDFAPQPGINFSGGIRGYF